MDKQTLKEMLMLYGADMTLWPEKEREEAELLLTKDEGLYQLVKEQQVFEKQAINRPLLQDNPVFVQNIIAMAAAEEAAQQAADNMQRQREDVKASRGFFAEIWGIFALPKPAYAMVACAVLGFCLGMFSLNIAPTDMASVEGGSNAKTSSGYGALGVELSYFDALSGVSEVNDVEEGFDMGDWL